MKLACLGDLHIGGARRAVCERVLMEIADDATRRGAAGTVVAGDVFDASSTAQDRLFLRRWLEALPGERLLISGNHDPVDELAIADAFLRRSADAVFAFAESPARIHVFEEPAVLDLEMGGHVLRAACLPDLRATFLAKRLLTMPPGATPLDAARGVLDELGAQMAAPGPRLFVGHLTLGSARMDNDQPARAVELAWPLADLARVPADAYVLGHIHLRQQWQLGGVPVFYTGSQYATNCGELAAKSWTMLHWDGQRFEVEIIPTSAPRLVLLVGTWHRDGDVAEMRLAYDAVHATDRGVVAADLADAETRLRYVIPEGDKKAAARAAAEHAAAIRAQGGACKLDPVPPVRDKTRASLLEGARTMPDKIDAFWRADGSWPDAERRGRIHAHVARMEPKIERAAPISLVRIDKLAWRGFGKLQAPGEAPLDRAGVQVLVGPNQAGKSTLVSLFQAGLWGEGAKGSLDSLASKGAALSLDVTTAHGTWRIEHDVSGKTVTVWQGGEPIVAGRTPYKAWAKKHLPAADVLEWTTCLPPEGKGLLGLVDGPLRTALLTLAGAPIFANLAKIAADEMGELRGMVRSLTEAVQRAGDPQAALTAAQASLADLRARAVAFAAEQRAVVDLQRAQVLLGTAERACDEIQRARTGLATQRAALEGRLVRARAQEAARAAHAAAVKESQLARAALAQVADEVALLQQEAAALREHEARARARAVAERARAARMAARLIERSACERAAAALPAAIARAAQAERAVEEAAAVQDQGSPRRTLETIRETASSARLKPALRLMDGALVRIRDAADVALSAPTKGELRDKLHDRAVALAQQQELAAAAARLPQMAADEVEQREAETEADEDEQHAALLAWNRTEVEARLALATAEQADLRERAERVETDASRLAAAVVPDELGPLQGRLAALAEQDAALAEQDAAAALARQQAERAVQAADEGGRQVGCPTPRAAVDRRARELATAIAETDRALARADAETTGHERAVARLAADRENLALFERDLGDLQELVRVLSPKCIQAFEAERIGVEIAGLATDLLHTHGFRWTLDYDPLREGVEQARWKLTELETGKSYDARTKGGGASQGQAFVVMTAMFLAARQAVQRRGGGIEQALLTIDEMVGAVREPNVQPWLTMLRDGAARSQTKVIFLVPPNDPRLIEACDGRIHVEPTGPETSVVR